MFIGSGSIQGMIISLRNNKALLRKKNRFKKERSFLNTKKEYYKAAGGRIELEKANPKQLKEIREKIIKQRKAKHIKNLLFFSLSIPLVCFGLYMAFNNFSFGFPKYNVPIEENTEAAKDKYLYFIADGDSWLRKHKWHNATFQYRKAVELFPSDFDANYRLALAYSYQCQYDFKNCEIGKKLIDKLQTQFPENENIKKVKETLDYWSVK